MRRMAATWKLPTLKFRMPCRQKQMAKILLRYHARWLVKYRTITLAATREEISKGTVSFTLRSQGDGPASHSGKGCRGNQSKPKDRYGPGRIFSTQSPNAKEVATSPAMAKYPPIKRLTRSLSRNLKARYFG